MARPLTGGAFAVEFEAHCRLIILVNDGLAAVSLCFGEKLCPLHACDHAIAFDEISLGGATVVDLLLL